RKCDNANIALHWRTLSRRVSQRDETPGVTRAFLHLTEPLFAHIRRGPSFVITREEGKVRLRTQNRSAVLRRGNGVTWKGRKVKAGGVVRRRGLRVLT